MEDQKQLTTIKFSLINSSDKIQGLSVEPWGEYYEMPPKAEYLIVVYSTNLGLPEVQVRPDNQLCLYAWHGAMLSIFDADKEEITPKRDISRGF